MNYTLRSELEGKRIYLGGRYTKDYYFGTIENRLIHKALCKELTGAVVDVKDTISGVLHRNAERIQQRAILILYIEPERYTGIKDGEAYYKNLISSYVDKYDNDEQKEQLNGEISVALSEYCNWIRVCSSGDEGKAIEALLEQLDIGVDVKEKAERIFLEELLFERKIDHSRIVYEDLQLYNYSRRSIEALMENGTATKMHKKISRQIIKEKKRKLRKKKRKKRKNDLKKIAKKIIRRLRKIKNNLLRGENDVKR